MNAETEVLILPYDVVDGVSVVKRLVTELQEGGWRRLRAAVHSAKYTGNFPALLDALVTFAGAGNAVELTFGADVFRAGAKGTDYAAIETLLARLDAFASVRLFLYHEAGRTFHPKLYLFDAEAQSKALLIIGSSNWTEGGFVSNVEVDVVVHLDLTDEEHRATYDRIVKCFADYWSEQ
jgi:phosphatidylserine/phosphatidylglycerophosphate/cardiolipin synthase-like enzyme